MPKTKSPEATPSTQANLSLKSSTDISAMNIVQPIWHDHKLMRNILRLLFDAQKAILKIYFSSKFEVQYKRDLSPVTDADIASHEILTSGLAKLTPEILSVSEEGQQSVANAPYSGTFWLIDPLDGTKGFIKRNGEFTVNLALISEGSTRIGFVGNPSQNLLYWGGKGLGAFSAPSNSPSDISSLRVHSRENGVHRVLTSRNDTEKRLADYINSLEGKAEIIRADSSLKFLKIAEGNADIYPRFAPTSEWDTAAAHAVLEGAGGSVLQPCGEAVRYGKSNICNPYFIAKGAYTPSILK